MTAQQIKADIGLSTYDEINETLDAFKKRLDKVAASIGADNATANVWIEYVADMYDGGGYIDAYVWRWETNEEQKAREARETAKSDAEAKAATAARETHERQTYEALKAKFEG